MSNQQTVLTTLSCAGSLAALLAISSPAIASPVATAAGADSDNGLPTLAQSDSNPIIDALGCTCARCTMGAQRPIF